MESIVYVMQFYHSRGNDVLHVFTTKEALILAWKTAHSNIPEIGELDEIPEVGESVFIETHEAMLHCMYADGIDM